MADAVINGKCYDWSDITIDIPGMEDAQVTEISYDLSMRLRQSMALEALRAAMEPAIKIYHQAVHVP